MDDDGDDNSNGGADDDGGADINDGNGANGGDGVSKNCCDGGVDGGGGNPIMLTVLIGIAFSILKVLKRLMQVLLMNVTEVPKWR